MISKLNVEARDDTNKTGNHVNPGTWLIHSICHETERFASSHKRNSFAELVPVYEYIKRAREAIMEVYFSNFYQNRIKNSVLRIFFPIPYVRFTPSLLLQEAMPLIRSERSLCDNWPTNYWASFSRGRRHVWSRDHLQPYVECQATGWHWNNITCLFGTTRANTANRQMDARLSW